MHVDSASQLPHDQLLECLRLGQALTAELDPDRLPQLMLERVSGLVPADNWSLLILDEEAQELYFAVSVGLEWGQVKALRLKADQGIAGQALQTRRPQIVADVAASPYFHPEVDRLTGFATRSLIAVPLVCRGRPLGVIEAVNPHRLDPTSEALLTIVADFVAIAVENAGRYQRVHELSIHDNLTGLYNTRYMYQALEDLVAAGRGGAGPFSLVFMDVDNFKRVVDAHGHLNGSLALQQVAATIRQTLAPPAFGVSYGGDEFVVVLPGQGKAEAVRTSEAIRAAMAAAVYLADQGLAVPLRASFGLAAYPEDADDLGDLLALADAAMFRVKGGGKNAVAAT
jgi:diguanylate cyclase (GGDEF)-like protein